MIIQLPEDRAAFVAQISEFVDKKYPASLRKKQENRQDFTKSDYKRWHGILAKAGWGACHWPVEHGGTGWDEWNNYLFYSTLVAKNAHQVLPFGINMLAPLLMAFGTPEQKEIFLPKIRTGEQIWCQGYSEPNAGSDLASLQMRAERHGDHYLLNGTKMWTTLAHVADWIFCLVRTRKDGKPQTGISFILVDLSTPGITINPIITADRAHEVNTVIFENVKVPVSHLVGEENKGWDCAKYLLMFERSSFGANIAMLEGILADMKSSICELLAVDRSRTAFYETLMAHCLRVESDLLAAKLTMLRALTDPDAMHARKIASLLKVLVSRSIQSVTDCHLKLYQELSLVNGASLSPTFFLGAQENFATLLANRYLNHRKESIYAGSNEIQYNVIAKMILGL
ncbi:MAG: pimeloyl-CoA dehydrogenase large subunit [Legionellales bacterium]|nr:pimeloyl-CoA dehydrogenase large subunit [Legionellales bacterium]|tara:strand:- start:327 stop:1520 length:1194 start_codon:yes stop_codon:yes gene_type:complete